MVYLREKNIDFGVIRIEIFWIFGIMYMGICLEWLNSNGKMRKKDKKHERIL